MSDQPFPTVELLYEGEIGVPEELQVQYPTGLMGLSPVPDSETNTVFLRGVRAKTEGFVIPPSDLLRGELMRDGDYRLQLKEVETVYTPEDLQREWFGDRRIQAIEDPSSVDDEWLGEGAYCTVVTADMNKPGWVYTMVVGLSDDLRLPPLLVEEPFNIKAQLVSDACRMVKEMHIFPWRYQSTAAIFEMNELGHGSKVMAAKVDQNLDLNDYETLVDPKAVGAIHASTLDEPFEHNCEWYLPLNINRPSDRHPEEWGMTLARLKPGAGLQIDAVMPGFMFRLPEHMAVTDWAGPTNLGNEKEVKRPIDFGSAWRRRSDLGDDVFEVFSHPDDRCLYHRVFRLVA